MEEQFLCRGFQLSFFLHEPIQDKRGIGMIVGQFFAERTNITAIEWRFNFLTVLSLEIAYSTQGLTTPALVDLSRAAPARVALSHNLCGSRCIVIVVYEHNFACCNE
jgi:hypothetical protein